MDTNQPARKKIFIPTNYDGQILGIFAAFDKSYVETFLLGKGQTAHKIEEIDIYDNFTYALPLVTLCTAYEQKGYNLKDSNNYVFIKRGN